MAGAGAVSWAVFPGERGNLPLCSSLETPLVVSSSGTPKIRRRWSCWSKSRGNPGDVARAGARLGELRVFTWSRKCSRDSSELLPVLKGAAESWRGTGDKGDRTQGMAS